MIGPSHQDPAALLWTPPNRPSQKLCNFSNISYKQFRNCRTEVAIWEYEVKPLVASHQKSLTSCSIYASPPFKFLINDNSYYIHAELVSAVSRPLDRMVNGEMVEATRGYAVLDQVEEGTFARFIEWAYKGYYTAAEVETRQSDSGSPKVIATDGPSHEDGVVSDYGDEERNIVEVVAEPPEVDNQAWAMWGNQTYTTTSQLKKKHKLAKRAGIGLMAEDVHGARKQMREDFEGRQYTTLNRRIEIPPARKNQSPNEIYTEVFLCHARLFVFAETYDIQDLKILALENLHNTLSVFTFHPERTGDVIELLRYVYSNTGESQRGVEDLRTMMTQYIGCEMDTLLMDPDFRILMMDGEGALLDNFLSMVVKRI